MTAKVLPFKQASIWEPVLDAKGKKIPTFIRHKPSGIIHLQKTFKKLGAPRLQVTTGETTIGKAKSKAQILVQQHVNKHLGIEDEHALVKTGGKTFGEMADAVLEHYTPTKRTRTRDNHKFYIGACKDEFGAMALNIITPELFSARIAKLRKKMKRQTFFDYAKAMNIVMRYAYAKKACTHLVKFADPDKKPEGEDEVKKSGRVYTEKEISALWGAMNEDTRDQFVLSYECMMRLREALRLTWDRVNLETGQITLRAQDVKTGSKTGKGRKFIMSPKALKRLQRRRAEITGSRFVFPSPTDPNQPVEQNKDAWKRAKKRAKLSKPDKARWHDLRHTALNNALLIERKNPVAVSEYAGVSLRTIQAVYLHAKADDTKDISSAVSIKEDPSNED